MITCNCGAVVGNIIDHYELWHGGVPKAKVRDYREFWDAETVAPFSAWSQPRSHGRFTR